MYHSQSIDIELEIDIEDEFDSHIEGRLQDVEEGDGGCSLSQAFKQAVLNSLPTDSPIYTMKRMATLEQNWDTTMSDVVDRVGRLEERDTYGLADRVTAIEDRLGSLAPADFDAVGTLRRLEKLVSVAIDELVPDPSAI